MATPLEVHEYTPAQARHNLSLLHAAAASVSNAPYQKNLSNWASGSAGPTRAGSAAPQRATRSRTTRTGASTPLPAPQPQAQQQQLPAQYMHPYYPQMPAPQSYPPPNPIKPSLQALSSTYASRMATGTSLLMQPIVGGSGGAATTSRTSRRGAAISYVEPGSGDELLDAGAGLDSEDSDFVNESRFMQSIAPTTAQKNQIKDRRAARQATGMSTFNATTGVTAIQPAAPPPARERRPDTVVPRDGTASAANEGGSAQNDFPYLCFYYDRHAAYKHLPVPIRVEFETETHRIRDAFVWDLSDDMIHPPAFARIFCQDLGLADEHADTVANQIFAQLEEHEAVVRVDLANEDFDQPVGGELQECRVMLSIDVQIGNNHLIDNIEWDLSSTLTPEAFATTLCRDLGLSGEAIPLVAHAVHEEIIKHKKDCIEWGVVDSGGMGIRDKTGLGLSSVGRARGQPKVLESVWRDWAEADELRTRFEVLSVEEVERREMERERASRRMRRETNKFQSSRRRTRF
ncbi:SWI/SNF chromatin remodeling complex [Mycena kentingensis (nom. inval.)]|nr:SWI/SNF chromatin remodeling complex [Mycena kentingensis (nom. inval.)]